MSGGLYLVQLLGDGSDASPFTVPEFQPGSGQLYFTEAGIALQWLPQRIVHPRYEEIAAHPSERLTTGGRNRIGNRFGAGLTLDEQDVHKMLLELFQRHGDFNDRRRWNPLLPSKARSQLEIHLGELGIVARIPVAPTPATTTQTETWPGTGDLASATPALTWVEDANLTVIGAGTPNFAHPQAANALTRVRTTSAVDTANHEVTATCDFLNTATVAVSNRLRARQKSDGTDEAYELLLTRNDTPSHARQNRRRQVSNNATLYQDTTTPGTTGVACSIKADGSSITITAGALSDTQTDTAVTANVQWGFAQLVGTGGTTTDARILANLVCADVVAASAIAAISSGYHQRGMR